MSELVCCIGWRGGSGKCPVTQRSDSNFCASKADMPKGPRLDEKSAFKEIVNRLHLSLPSWDQSLKAITTRRAVASFLSHHALISEKGTVGRREDLQNCKRCSFYLLYIYTIRFFSSEAVLLY